MELATKCSVEVLRSGLVVRDDPSIGLLIFSPHTGLTYAVHAGDAIIVKEWLNSPTTSQPPSVYEEALGAGWAIPIDMGKYPIPHLLPNRNSWSNLPSPERPILINWFLTGRCPLACKYCWAEDLMRDDANEPNVADIRRIGDGILDLRPLTVVLTGGDPLFSPHLAEAIQLLSGKAGIILDTSGYTFSSRHLKLFKEHKVAVRISIDSDRPKVNEAQRPIHAKYPAFVRSGLGATEAALNAICECLDAGISVTVQSVATRKNANDLLSLGDKLYRLGVRCWRVGKVAPSIARMDEYIKLVGSVTDKGKKIKGKQSRGPYEYVFKKLHEAQVSMWHRSMAVQVMHNGTRNAVILVGPDGTFYTESNVVLGKVVLDSGNPKSPSIESIQSKVNMLAHAERYLNLTSP